MFEELKSTPNRMEYNQLFIFMFVKLFLVCKVLKCVRIRLTTDDYVLNSLFGAWPCQKVLKVPMNKSNFTWAKACTK